MEIGKMQSGYVASGNEMNVAKGKKKSFLGTDASMISKNKTAECMAFLREKSEEILEKLRNGETEVTYQIGGASYTEKEWDKLLEKFDDIQEDVRRKMEERIRKMEMKEEKLTEER